MVQILTFLIQLCIIVRKDVCKRLSVGHSIAAWLILSVIRCLQTTPHPPPPPTSPSLSIACADAWLHSFLVTICTPPQECCRVWLTLSAGAPDLQLSCLTPPHHQTRYHRLPPTPTSAARLTPPFVQSDFTFITAQLVPMPFIYCSCERIRAALLTQNGNADSASSTCGWRGGYIRAARVAGTTVPLSNQEFQPANLSGVFCMISLFFTHFNPVFEGRSNLFFTEISENNE